MLIQTTQVSTLDPGTKARLFAAANQLLYTNEAQTGIINFEGKAFRVDEVRQLASIQNRQFLAEG